MLSDDSATLTFPARARSDLHRTSSHDEGPSPAPHDDIALSMQAAMAHLRTMHDFGRKPARSCISTPFACRRCRRGSPRTTVILGQRRFFPGVERNAVQRTVEIPSRCRALQQLVLVHPGIRGKRQASCGRTAHSPSYILYRSGSVTRFTSAVPGRPAVELTIVEEHRHRERRIPDRPLATAFRSTPGKKPAAPDTCRRGRPTADSVGRQKVC